jgi:cytochrome d ubiquinol oxidase subunit II
MTLGAIVAMAMLASLIVYALLGGADFGGGVWDLFASGKRAEAQRVTIAHAIGPIWEANHVWLIITLVIMFSAFPRAYAAILTALHIPLTLMLVGIVLRGTSFVFRTYDTQESAVQRRWGRVFAISSLFTPILLGISVGAISTPGITLDGHVVTSGFFGSWLRPFPVAVGLFALAQFAFLAATYLTVESDDPDVCADFRRRALLSAVAVGIIAGAVLLLARDAAPQLHAGLLDRTWSWPHQGLTAATAIGAIVMLWKRKFVLARLLAAAQVALILVGWGFAMNPYLIAGTLTVHEAAAPDSTLRLLLWTLAAGGVILLPSFLYLFRTFKGKLIFADIEGD